MTDERQLAGRTAVAPGAGRSIGRSVALAFARAGAELALYMATLPAGGPTGQTFSLARRPL